MQRLVEKEAPVMVMTWINKWARTPVHLLGLNLHHGVVFLSGTFLLFTFTAIEVVD